MEDKENIEIIFERPEPLDINNIKTFEEMKEEFKENYDKYMYDMNIEFLKGLNQKDIVIYDLQQENKQNQNKLNKIEEYVFQHELVDDGYILNGDELLKIIKGADNE